jgi:hypothetical protein
MYQRDGFTISPPDASQIQVTNSTGNWSCEENSLVAKFLWPKRKNVSLRSLGKHLVVFERTIVAKDEYEQQRKHQDKKKGCLKVEPGTLNKDIWILHGVDIYEAEGDGDDLVVQSPNYLRLWDMSTEKFRWEKDNEPGEICRIRGFTKEHIIREVGHPRLYKRSTGRAYGDYHYPQQILRHFDWDEKTYFGPVVSTGGVFLYVCGKKTLLLYQFDDQKDGKHNKDKGQTPVVRFQIWQSTTSDIQGSLVLRGNLNNIELEFLEQKHSWKKLNAESPILQFPWVKSWLV